MDRNDGNKKYFESLVTSYYKYVKKFIFILTLDESLAAQAAQKTFAKVWSRLKQIGTDDDIPAKLCTLAREVLTEEYQVSEPSAKRPDLTFIDDLEMSVSFMEHIKDADLESEELKIYFDSLDTEQLRILLLHFYYDLPSDLIDETLSRQYQMRQDSAQGQGGIDTKAFSMCDGRSIQGPLLEQG